MTQHRPRIKLKSPVRALELLGRHCGMFVDRVEVTEPDRYTDMDPDELRAELDQMVRRRFEGMDTTDLVEWIAELESLRAKVGGMERRTEACRPRPERAPEPRTIAPVPSPSPEPNRGADVRPGAPGATPGTATPPGDTSRELDELRRRVAELRGELTVADSDPAADEAWKAEAAYRDHRERHGDGPLPDERPLGPAEEW